MPFAFLWAFLFSPNALADLQCPKPPKISISKEVPCVAPLPSQRDAEWCFLYSAHALVQQHVCLAQAHSAPNLVAFRDVIRAYNKDFGTRDLNHEPLEGLHPYSWKRPGRAADVLHSVANGGRLALESCAPTADFTRWTQRPVPPDSQMTPIEHLKSEYDENLRSGRDPVAPSGDVHFVQDFNDAIAIAGGNVDRFLDALFVPPRCRATALRLPRMKIMKDNPQTGKDIEQKVEEVVSHNRALEISLCRAILGGEKFCGGGHSVLIGGFRNVCCEGTCEKQYLVFDSSPLNPRSGGSYWAASRRVVDATLMYNAQKNESFLEAIKVEIQNLKSELLILSVDTSIDSRERDLRRDELLRKIRNRQRSKLLSGSLTWIENP